MMSLKKIDLGRNNITDRGILIITKAMNICSSIVDINIRDYGNTATINFSSGFNKSDLHRLSVSPSSPPENKADERAFLRLSLVNCMLTFACMHKLGLILLSYPRLAELDLSGNELKDRGFRVFLKILPNLSISKFINLSNNGISETAALHLLRSIKLCPRIAEVRVSLKNFQTVFINFAEDHEGTDDRDGRSSAGNPKARPCCLTTLSLTNCYFQLKQLEELVCALDHCRALRELDLSNNSLGDKGIKKLVDLLPNLHVSSLINISNNSITLGGVLYLIKYMKKSEDVVEIAMSLKKNGRGLLKFHRSCRERESGGSSDLLSREAKIGNLDSPMPKKISLEECKMDDQNMENLCTVINGCRGLTELDLSNNGLNDEVLTKLLNYLPDLQDLKILSFSERHISSDTVLLLASSLNICEEVVEVEVRSSRKALIRLSKRGDSYSDGAFYFPHTIPEELSPTFSPHPRFQENGKKLSVPQPRFLSVKDCELDKSNVRDLLLILAECKDLCRVDLSCNSLGDEGLRCLRDFIPKLNILKLLDISRNEISPTGVLYLVESLNTCRSVAEVEVSLASNGKFLIKFEKRHEKRTCRDGSEYKAAQPTSNWEKEGPDRDVCRRISLRDCSFKEEHLTKLSSIVECCSHLTELDLSCNKLGDRGLSRLVEVVAGLKDLKELDLQKNGISLCAMAHLFETLKCSQSPLTLRLEEQWIQASAAVNLAVSCVQNHPNIAAIRIKNTSVLVQLATNNHQLAGNFWSDNSRLRQCAIQAPQLLELLPVIRMYPHLSEIDLSHNDIGDRGAEELGKILQDVHGLRKLSLESIGTSPAGARMLAMGLGRCLDIEELNLSQNELGEAGASEMGKVLSQMERLKKINLCRRRTASGSSVGGQLLAKGLSNCIKLEEINLDSLELGDSGVQLLAMGLLTMPHLKKLNLRSNSISSRGAAQLADCLRGSTEIEDIDLCDNYIEDLGANKLADVLPNMKHLKKLNLTRNNITAAGGSKVVEALGQCPSVQEIHLSSNKTGDQTATRLAQTLPKLPCMKILNLQSNDIGVDGGVQLARGLFVCTTIEEISLPENKIGNKGVLELAVALKELKLLKKLDLRLNGVNDCVVEELAAGLSHCPRVQEIVLSWNGISDWGAVKLAEVLPRMPGLKKLDLEGNKITAVGAERLVESLGQCPFIEVIRLWKNNTSRDQEQSLQEQEPRLNFSSTP
ncbi:NLR family, CARD domain containing 5 isoform X2 [Callorhinchus milii]|uniref:NLR family, CARD domain containing 5 isoform X2 n=1 Tax=Callorhinchus milii TaxID=7868 RepID=UPI001C3F9A2D|nr:NLR family, CARD domain containing 5 isoform X2 [Callorhinchus milii]